MSISLLPGRAAPARLGLGSPSSEPIPARASGPFGPSWLRTLALLFLVVGGGWSAPLGILLGLTITGDRVLGVAALAAVVVLAVRRRVCWTGVHTALAVFVGSQVLTTLVNLGAWPQGQKFVTIYILGFACFVLAFECTRGTDEQRWLTRAWIGVAALLAVAGTVAAYASNVYQEPLWGSSGAQRLFPFTPHERVLFAARATFKEWNLFSSFMLIPFSLGLWAWHRDAAGRGRLVAALTAIVFGLVAGVTRAAWLSMAGIVLLWWRLRRPRPWQLVALVVMAAVALVLQALCLGAVPVWERLFGQPSNIEHRMIINRITIESWIQDTVPGPPPPAAAELPAAAPAPLAVPVPPAPQIPSTAPPPPAPRAAPAAPVPPPVHVPPAAPAFAPPAYLRAAHGVILGRGAGSVDRLTAVFPIAGRVRIWTGNIVLFVLHDSGVLGLAALLGLVVVVVRRAVPLIAPGAGGPTTVLVVPLLASGAGLCFAYQFTHGLWIMYPYVYLGFLTAVLKTAAEAEGIAPRRGALTVVHRPR